MKFKGEVLHTILTQILCLIFGVGVSILLNRVLGPTLKGELVALLLIPQLIVSFINLGLGMSGSYFMGKREYPDGEIVKTNLLATLLLGIIGIGIGWWIFANVFPNISLLLKLILLSLVIWDLWLCYVPDFFLGKGLITQHNIWNLSRHIGKFFLIAIFFITFRDKSVETHCNASLLSSAIVAISCVGGLSFLLSFPVLSRWIKLRGKVNFSYLKKGVNFGYKLFLIDLLAFLNYRLDILLLKIFTDATKVGYYSTAVYMVECLWLIPRAVYLAFYSRFVTGKLEKGEGNRILRLTLWITALVGVGSVFFIKPIINFLYTPSFLPAFSPYVILLPGVIALVLPKLLMSEVMGSWGRPEILLWGMLITVGVNIGLNIFFIPKYGMNGAALASTIAYICELVFFVLIYKKRSSVLEISLKNIFRK